MSITLTDAAKFGLKAAIFITTGNASSLGSALGQAGLRTFRDELQESSPRPQPQAAPPRGNPTGGQVVDEAG